MKKKIPKYNIGQTVYIITNAPHTICPTCNQQVRSWEKIIVQAAIEEIHILRTYGDPEIGYVLSTRKMEDDREILSGGWDESIVYSSKKAAEKDMKNYK